MSAPRSLMALFEPGRRADPYPLYRELRDRHPVFWDEWLQTWVVLDHATITALLKDVRVSSERITGFHRRLPAGTAAELAPLAAVLGDMMVFADPPRHTALRRVARACFGPRRVRGMRDTIESVARDLVANLDGERFDVIGDFAAPLTKRTIVELTGLRPDAWHLLDDWVGLTHEFFVQSPAQTGRVRALRASFDRDQPARRAGLLDDLFSRAVAEEGTAERCTDDEVFATFLLLIDAGLSTTTYVVGNALRALLDHPDQLRAVRDDPALIPGAVRELFRYDSSVQYTTRVARSEIRVAGQVIAAGESLTFVLGAGNRDPARYPDPDRLDVTRADTDHLSFGHGVHHCLGATLATSEVEVALAALLPLHLRRVPQGEEWLDSINFRFLRRLPVAIA